MNWQQACELPYYGGSDLGANPAAEETVFKLWAPTACGVVVCLYATGHRCRARRRGARRA